LWPHFLKPRFGAPHVNTQGKLAAGASSAVGYAMIRIREIGFKSACLPSAAVARHAGAGACGREDKGWRRDPAAAKAEQPFAPGRLSQAAARGVGDPPGRGS
jgi:hypothetical protein